MALSDDVKASVSLKEVAERAGVEWSARKSRPRAGDWWGCCPFHSEASPSFHVLEPGGTGGVFYCFGCGAKGSVVDFVMMDEGLDFVGAVRRLADRAGVAREDDEAKRRAREAERKRIRDERDRKAAALAERRAERALDLWRRAVPDAPLLRDYLESRGVRTDALRRLFASGVPPSLRLVERLEHFPDGAAAPTHAGPAMVAAIGDCARGGFAGVHRTWITATGRARFPDGRKVDKQWLGRTGAIWGAPVRLSPPAPVLFVGEGIETSLALFSLALEDGREGIAAEAALSRGSLAGPADRRGVGPGRAAGGQPLPSAIPDFKAERRGWLPPDEAREVVILAEGSSKCPGAAERETRRALAKVLDALRAAERAAGEPTGLRTARIALPGGRWDRDLDFADLAAGEL